MLNVINKANQGEVIKTARVKWGRHSLHEEVNDLKEPDWYIQEMEKKTEWLCERTESNRV